MGGLSECLRFVRRGMITGRRHSRAYIHISFMAMNDVLSN